MILGHIRGDNVLFSVGNSPGNEVGSVVVSVDTEGEVSFEYALNEQGSAVTILNSGGSILIPGIDPNESWDFGNLYVNGTKKRNLTNVIHSFGACLHNGYVFVATGVHTGDEETFRGYVFRSDDLGETWDSPVQVSNHRVYDIISFNGLLYAIANNFLDPFLAVSDDDGQTWETVADFLPETLSKMVVFGDLLIVLSSDNNICAIDTNGDVELFDRPDGQTINSKWNIFAVNDGYLYVLCNDQLYRTADLLEWEWHCDLEKPCISLSVWDEFGIIVSEIGTDARLLRVPFNATP